MGFVFVFVALTVPRVLMFIAFLMTDWFRRGFETTLWPFLGFFLMPYTTLAYLAAMLNNDHVLRGGWLALFATAVFADIVHWGGGGHVYRRRRKLSSEKVLDL